MAALSLRTNIASLKAQRRLNDTVQQLGNSYERLSSGLRINRAVDDAAGLAMSSSLKLDGRVYAQAVLNMSDGVSAVNIADGALGELTSILQRQRELATQAANGSFSFTQRKALNAEANALVDEYNRIVQTTKFNGLNLLDGSLAELRLQAGYGVNGSIGFIIGDELDRYVSNTSFATGGAGASTGSDATVGSAVGDVNGDGIDDVLMLDTTLGQWVINFGSASSPLSTTVSASATWGIANGFSTLADVNGDGNLDVIVGGNTGLGVFLGNGQGSFGSEITSTTGWAGTGTLQVAAADFNGDGLTDLAISDTNRATIQVSLATGNGGFGASTSFSAGGSSVTDLAAGDFDRDGKIDIIAIDSTNSAVKLLRGNGSGGFSAATTMVTGVAGRYLRTGDLNGDGYIDFVTNTTNITEVFSTNSGGLTATEGQNFSTGKASRPYLRDINGDGFLDLAGLINGGSGMKLFFGQGNGTFATGVTISIGTFTSNPLLGDINGDGAIDIIFSSNSSDSVFYRTANPNEIATMPRLDLYDQAAALDAIRTIDAALTRVGKERGVLGSSQSRLQTTQRTLEAIRMNYRAADSLISDVDVAQETTNLVRLQILQQAGAAVLAQANQQPARLMTLLNDSVPTS